MLFLEHTFSLLVAPPAWGKTRLFREWAQNSGREFLFISPLRALATEVKAHLPEVWVALPEELVSVDWTGLAKAKPELVVVWDEVHLVPEWGESFRPLMLEAWWGFCVSGLTGVGFTATLTVQTERFLRQTLRENHTHILLGDAGNFQFKHSPQRWVIGDAQALLERLEQIDVRGTLIFCRTKQQLRRLQAAWPEAWSCVGGETAQFQARLHQSTPPMIIATSCLSHGVNLPPLRRVVILDSETPAWLAHQMRTRAGRRGEPFEIWCPWKTASCSPGVRLAALLKLKFVTMMSEAWTQFLECCYGPRRHRRTDHSAERT